VSLLHQETFPVRFFESEPTGRATPAAMCRFAQEAAEGHCRTIGMSLLDMRAQNRMWVLTRFRLQMDCYPKVGETVTVQTWASARTNGIRAVRDFCFLDSQGRPTGRGSSTPRQPFRERHNPPPRCIFNDNTGPIRQATHQKEKSLLF